MNGRCSYCCGFQNSAGACSTMSCPGSFYAMGPSLSNVPKTSEPRPMWAADLDALDARLTEYQKSVAITSDRLTAQSQDMAALRKRIEAMEGQGNPMRGATDASPRDSGLGQPSGSGVPQSASPTPPSPLVERICLIFHKQQSPTYPARCEMAKEALLVAAEELLEPVTDEEWNATCISLPTETSIPALLDDVLRARLARAKEAAK